MQESLKIIKISNMARIFLFTPPVLDVGGLMRYPQSDIAILYNLLKTNFGDANVKMKDFRFYFYDDFYKKIKKDNRFKADNFYRYQDLVNIILEKNVDKTLEKNFYSLYNTLKNNFLNIEYLIIPLSVYEQFSIEYFLSGILFSYYIKKEFPNIKIITFGEYHSHYLKVLMEKIDFIDAACLKGDKQAILNIINNFISEKFENTSNIIYKINKKLILPVNEYFADIHLDSIPDYSGFDLEVHKMKDNKLVLSYKLGEGCRNNCFYCYNVHKGGKFITKDIDKIVYELKSLVNINNTNLLNFNDSEINYSNDFLEKLSIEIIKQDLIIYWSALIIPRELDHNLLKLLYKAGCRQLRFGIESGSQKILDIIGKGTNIDEITTILSNCKKIGINTYASFIVDLPQENNLDIKFTMEYIYKNKELFDYIIICAYNGHIGGFDIKYLRYLLGEGNYSFCRTQRISKKKILLRKFCDKLGIFDIDIIDFLRWNY